MSIWRVSRTNCEMSNKNNCEDDIISLRASVLSKYFRNRQNCHSSALSIVIRAVIQTFWINIFFLSRFFSIQSSPLCHVLSQFRNVFVLLNCSKIWEKIALIVFGCWDENTKITFINKFFRKFNNEKLLWSVKLESYQVKLVLATLYLTLSLHANSSTSTSFLAKKSSTEKWTTRKMMLTKWQRRQFSLTFPCFQSNVN